MKVRKRVPLYRLGHLSLNNKLLRTLKPESRMLRALLHTCSVWTGMACSWLVGRLARPMEVAVEVEVGAAVEWL